MCAHPEAPEIKGDRVLAQNQESAQDKGFAKQLRSGQCLGGRAAEARWISQPFLVRENADASLPQGAGQVPSQLSVVTGCLCSQPATRFDS